MYTLVKTEINLKSAKFLYQVQDAEGNVISSRKTNREYVAATKEGLNYFGRVELAQAYKRKNPDFEIAYLAQ